MATLDFGKKVFEADASAANDWGSISAGAGFDFRGNIEARRGIDIDLGLMAIANLDASFSEYVAGDLSGQALAQASIRGQIQLPLNLFDEIGVAVRLQAVAELAAGIRLGLGLSIGDFLELAADDPHLDGVPSRLLMIFLEEVELKAGFYAKAALSAMAYANFVVTGSAVGQPQAGIGPGFTIAAGAGAGLKAGAGFEVFANVGIANFSRLVGRTVDCVVDETLAALIQAVPASDTQTRETLWAARTPAKLALRLTYELGEHLALRNAQHSAGGQDDVALRVVQVILEELQRASLEGLLHGALRSVTTTVSDLQQQFQSQWIACRQQRHALATKLREAPAGETGGDALPYWIEVADLTLNVAAQFASAQPGLRRLSAVLWAAAQLGAAIAGRVTRAQASVSLIGVPPRSTSAAFSGALASPPPPAIGTEIRDRLQQLGSPVSGALDHADLVLYLCDQTAIDVLRQHNPALVSFFTELLGPAAADVTALVRLVLQNGAAFPVGSGSPDPTAALQALSAGIARFVNLRLDDALRQGLEPAFNQHPDLRTAFDEVMIPSLRFSVEVVFAEAARWASSTTSKSVLTDALSSILLRVLGRSLVVTGDILLSEAQKNVSTVLHRAAVEADRPNGLIALLAAAPGVGLAAEEIGELVVDALDVASEVFAPMPAARRQVVRGLLYDAIDPLGGASPSEMMVRLNDFGMPDPATMDALARELGLYASERFVIFVQGLLLKIIERQIAAWREVIDAVVEVIVAWIDDLTAGLRLIGERLEEIGEAIADLVADIERLLEEAGGALHDLLDSFSSQGARDQFVDEAASAVSSRALGVLEDNWIYSNVVPSGLRADIRSTVRSIVRSGLRNEAVDSLLEAIGILSDEIDEIIDDARALDRSRPLGPQLRELVLGRVLDAVDEHFGTVRIDVRFDVHWHAFGVRVEETIDLGSIRIPIDAMTGAVRPMIAGLSVFDDAIDALANTLGALFTAEANAADLEDERAAVVQEQERTTAHHQDMQPGPKQVKIERPVAMQTTAGDAPVVIRFSGFRPTILDHDDTTPQRVHVILNGEDVDLRSFRVDHVVDGGRTIGARGPIPGSMIMAGGRVSKAARSLSAPQRGKTAGRRLMPAFGSAALRKGTPPNLRFDQPGGFTLSGTLPRSLVRPGINTLLVDVVASKTQRVHDSIGFTVVAPTTAKLPTGKPPKRRHPADLVKVPLPQAILASKTTVDIALPQERRARAATLASGITQVRGRPLDKLASVSPTIAKRLGRTPTALPSRQPVLAVIPQKGSKNA